MMATVALRGEASAEASMAVGELYRTHYRSLVRLASLLLDDVGTSEEVVQDAFIKVQLGWGRLRDPERAPAYLRSAVLNGARSRMRGGLVRRRHLQSVPPDAPPADLGALASDEHRRMIELLRALPTRQREALALRFYADLSEAETAAAMGVSAGSVKTHVHRGLAALRSQLEGTR